MYCFKSILLSFSNLTNHKDESGLVILRFPSHIVKHEAKDESHQCFNYKAWCESIQAPDCCKMSLIRVQSFQTHLKKNNRHRLFMNVSFNVTTSVSLRPPVTGFTGNQSCLTKSRCGGQRKMTVYKCEHHAFHLHDLLDFLYFRHLNKHHNKNTKSLRGWSHIHAMLLKYYYIYMVV